MLQGHCYASDPSACPSITLYSDSGRSVVSREAYLSSLAGLSYDARWPELGWLAFIAAFFATVALLSTKFFMHQRK